MQSSDMTKPKRAAAPKDATLYVRVTKDMKEAVERESARTDLSQEQVVRQVLRQWMEARA